MLNGQGIIITSANVLGDQEIHDSFVHDSPLVIIDTQ
jgi:hypothetical protein